MDFNEYMKSAIKDLYDCKIDELFKQDVILIDEGQDFKKEWFALLRDKFLNKNGSFVVFADEKQNIYETDYGEERLPNTGISGRWNELKKTYRSNYNLMKFAFLYSSSVLRQQPYIKTTYSISSNIKVSSKCNCLIQLYKKISFVN